MDKTTTIILVVGLVLIVILIICIVWICMRYRRKLKQPPKRSTRDRPQNPGSAELGIEPPVSADTLPHGHRDYKKRGQKDGVNFSALSRSLHPNQRPQPGMGHQWGMLNSLDSVADSELSAKPTSHEKIFIMDNKGSKGGGGVMMVDIPETIPEQSAPGPSEQTTSN